MKATTRQLIERELRNLDTRIADAIHKRDEQHDAYRASAGDVERLELARTELRAELNGE